MQLPITPASTNLTNKKMPTNPPNPRRRPAPNLHPRNPRSKHLLNLHVPPTPVHALHELEPIQLVHDPRVLSVLRYGFCAVDYYAYWAVNMRVM